MRPLLAALLLLPALGFAQSLVLTVNGATSTITGTGTTTTSTYAKNAASCNNNVAGNWLGTGLTTACTTLQVWLTTSTCGIAPSTTNSPPDYVVYTAQIGQLTGGLSTDTFSFALNLLPGFSIPTDGGVGTPCGSVFDFTNLLCAGVTLKDSTGACTSSTVTASPVNMRYDNIPPDPPLVSITPLDSKLSVRLTASGSGSAVSDIQSFQLYYAAEPPDGGTPSYSPYGGVISVNNPNVTISNLVNGENYLVQGYSVDEATNVSGPSTPATVGTPVLTYGFYANYLNDGGQPAGGCGDAAGGAPSAVAFLTVLLLGVARRRG
jgi:hypothetical protein